VPGAGTLSSLITVSVLLQLSKHVLLHQYRVQGLGSAELMLSFTGALYMTNPMIYRRYVRSVLQ
jgi:hypothetical protein